jgi:hypothetical protein
MLRIQNVILRGIRSVNRLVKLLKVFKYMCIHSQGTTTRKKETIYIRTTKHAKKNQARYKRRPTLIGRVDGNQE